MQKRFDVAIVGAGAAGLMAALKIANGGRSVAILEAADRCGGRMNTIIDNYQMPIELGAEFVHGKLSITLDLLKKAGITTDTAGGEFWQTEEDHLKKQNEQVQHSSALLERMKKLKEDISLKDFIDQQLHDFSDDDKQSLLRYAEGYYAADPARMSTLTMYEEMTKHDDEQFRPHGGYAGMVDYLEHQCRERGVEIFLSSPVRRVGWSDGKVSVETGATTITASKAVITVSLGVLQAERIAFSPALPQKTAAAKQLGYGHVQKLVYHFAEPFWKDKEYTQGQDLHKAGFLFSGETIPTWWMQYPMKNNVLTGWLAGPRAQKLANRSSDELINDGLLSLSNIFAIELQNLRRLVLSAHHYNWTADEKFCGAYSYVAVNAEEHVGELLQPVEDTLFFAGEGVFIGKEFGTVEAALRTGRDVAQKVIGAADKVSN